MFTFLKGGSGFANNKQDRQRKHERNIGARSLTTDAVEKQ
jgi:hypothetical protein